MGFTGTIIRASMRGLNDYFPGAFCGSPERVKKWLEGK